MMVGLWCFTPHSTVFQLSRRGKFYWWGKPKYSEKTTDLSQVINCITVTYVKGIFVIYRLPKGQ